LVVGHTTFDAQAETIRKRLLQVWVEAVSGINLVTPCG